VPELMLASLIAGERLPQVHGYGPHPLVANAEFALLDQQLAKNSNSRATQGVIPVYQQRKSMLEAQGGSRLRIGEGRQGRRAPAFVRP